MKGNRIAWIVGVVVIAAVVGFLALRNYWPPKSGTEGAIGAANRYTAQQISDQDVTLKDAQVQAFLQSDTFHQIATNPDFRTFVEAMVTRSSDARTQVADRLARSADALQGFRLPENAIAALKDDYASKLPTAQVEALLSKGGLSLLSDAAFAQALDKARVREAAAKGTPELLEAVRPMRGGDQLATRLGDFLVRHPDMRAAIADARFGQWVRSDNVRTMTEALNRPTINSDLLAAALADMNTRTIISDAAFQRLGDSKSFITALKDAGFQKILASSLDLNKTLMPAE